LSRQIITTFTGYAMSQFRKMVRARERGEEPRPRQDLPGPSREVMLGVRAENTRRQKKPGRPPKLAIEDQILLTLEYWREYRTQFHMAHRWGRS